MNELTATKERLPTLVTVVTAEVLLHYYYRHDPMPTESYNKALQRLLALGVIVEGNDKTPYVLTPRGDAWVRLILNTPMPQLIYVDEHGNPIE